MVNLATEYIKVKVLLYKYTPSFKYKDNSLDVKPQTYRDAVKKLEDLKNQKAEKQITSIKAYQSKAKVESPFVILKEWKVILNSFSDTSVGLWGDFRNHNKGHNKKGQTAPDIIDSFIATSKTGPRYLGMTLEYWFRDKDAGGMTIILDRIVSWYIENQSSDLDKIISLSDGIKDCYDTENSVSNPLRMDENRKQLFLKIHEFLETTYDLPTERKNAKLREDKKVEIKDFQPPIDAAQKVFDDIKKGVSKISQFTVELDEKFYSKIDISDLVTDYSYSQGLDGNITWSINLMNTTIDIKDKGKYFIKEGENVILNSNDFESEDDNFNNKMMDIYGNLQGSENDIERIKKARKLRCDNFRKEQELTQDATAQEVKKNNDDRNPQIMIGDLIQKFDFVSCFIYKDTKPPVEDTIIRQSATDEVLVNQQETKRLQDIAKQDAATYAVTDSFGTPTPAEVLASRAKAESSASDLAKQKEMPVKEYEYFLMANKYSNEFNGFLISKNVSMSTGGFNTISISGVGSYGLWDRTKVIYNSSMGINSIYDQGELGAYDARKMSFFTSIFAGKSIFEIINILLSYVYRIESRTFNQWAGILKQASQLETYKKEQLDKRKENLKTKAKALSYYNESQNQQATVMDVMFNKSSPLATGQNTDLLPKINELVVEQAEIKKLSTPKSVYVARYGRNVDVYNDVSKDELEAELSEIDTSFYLDLAKIKIENQTNTNYFTIAPFLFALVMKGRDFQFKDITATQLTEAETSINENNKDKKSLGKAIDNYYQNNSTYKSIEVKNNVSLISYELNNTNLAPYFLMFSTAFKNWSPQLKTPNQILQEVKNAAMVEIFENPSATLTIRVPKINDLSTAISSDDFNIISTAYSDNIKGVISKEKLSYHTDMIQQAEFMMYSFTNGKNFMQYGLTETDSSANPNVNYLTPSVTNVKDTVNVKGVAGIFNYVRMFLELNNAAQKSSTISMEYVPATVGIYSSADEQIDVKAFNVGNLFYDSRNAKLSYIVGIEKSCTIGGALSMKLKGTYVRDAYKSPGTPLMAGLDFRQLPLLSDINAELKQQVQGEGV